VRRFKNCVEEHIPFIQSIQFRSSLQSAFYCFFYMIYNIIFPLLKSFFLLHLLEYSIQSKLKSSLMPLIFVSVPTMFQIVSWFSIFFASFCKCFQEYGLLTYFSVICVCVTFFHHNYPRDSLQNIFSNFRKNITTDTRITLKINHKNLVSVEIELGLPYGWPLFCW
jgi:hypothetical protein